MGKQINVVCLKVGGQPEKMSIDRDDFENIEKICEGEFLCNGNWDEEGIYDIYHNATGKEEGKPFNRQFLGQNYYGNIIICRMHENSESLNDEQIEHVINILNAPEAAIEVSENDTDWITEGDTNIDMINAIEKSRENMHKIVDEKCDALLEYINNPRKSILSELKVNLSIVSFFFKGKKPNVIILGNNKKINVKTWREVADILLKDCNSNPERHNKMLELRNRVFGRSRTILSDVPDDMDVPMKIDEDLYFEGKFDTEFLLRVLKERIFDNVGYDYSSIEVELREREKANEIIEEPEEDVGISMQL